MKGLSFNVPQGGQLSAPFILREQNPRNEKV